jgi:hypothetical protein
MTPDISHLPPPADAEPKAAAPDISRFAKPGVVKQDKLEIGVPKPVSGEVPGLVERGMEYLFAPPERQEIDPGQIGLMSGIGAVTGAGLPKGLEYLGKGMQRIPGGYPKIAGKATELAGVALGKTPMYRRVPAGAAAGAVGDITEQLGETQGFPRVVTLPVSVLTSAAGGYTTDVIGRALGIEAKGLSKELREKGVQLTEEALRRAGFTQDQAQKELLRLQKIERQLSEREMTAAERAAQRQTTPMAAERQAVFEKVAAERVRAQDAARAAGLNEEAAARLVADAEQGVLRSKQAIDALEQQMVNMPSMTKEAFGKPLQTTTQKLYDEGNLLRQEVSGFVGPKNSLTGKRGPGIVQQLGNSKIPTANLLQGLKTEIDKTGNPTVRNVLLAVQKEVEMGGQGAMSLTKADSLKGYLDSIINAKQFGETKLDKEVLAQVRKAKGALIDSIQKGAPQYIEAMGKFRTLSRPLDIVERNGALARVIEKDPMSTAYKMQEAEVVGYIIEKAKAGNKVFERLIEKNADIKDAAKLYFTKDLFGKEVAPSDAVLRTWLKDNESVLKRIGIFEDFRNLRVARTTAEEAVNEAKGVVEAAKVGLREAKAGTAAAEAEATRASSVQKKAGGRLEEALKIAEPLEDILKRSAARARPVEAATKQGIGAAERSIEQQRDIIKEFKSLDNYLSGPEKIAPKEVPKVVEDVALRMLKDDVITQQEADFIVNQTRKNADQFADVAKARTMLKRILYGLGVGGLAGGAYRFTGQSDTIRY